MNHSTSHTNSNADPNNKRASNEPNRTVAGTALTVTLLVPLCLVAPIFLSLILPFNLTKYSQTVAHLLLSACVIIVLIYTARHYLFSINRLFCKQKQLYIDLPYAQWPNITVLIMAHNEERVIRDSLLSLINSDYPKDKLVIMPVNDRSTDKTAEIIDQLAKEYANIKPLHRLEGEGGKPAALDYACQHIETDIFIVFDADYLPGKGLLKQLVCPFFDPEVGATMGRVIPLNAQSNLLTRLLMLERCGGYQVNQQARQNLNLTTQFGGTVGGIRTSALEEVGGWGTDCLAEDTDLTIRLRCGGWKVVYQNRAECYEEVPEEWSVRIRQLQRWAGGHQQVLINQWLKVLRCEPMGFAERFDTFLLLAIYMLSPVILIGWSSGAFLFYTGDGLLINSLMGVVLSIAYAGFGNFAIMTEITVGAYLDRSRNDLILLPFMLFVFIINSVEITRTVIIQSWKAWRGQSTGWNKTTRYRKTTL